MAGSTRIVSALKFAALAVVPSASACGARTELIVDPATWDASVALDVEADRPALGSDGDAAPDTIDAADAVEDVHLAPDPPQQVAVGRDRVVCVLRESGAVDCWGGSLFSFGRSPGRRIRGIGDATSVCAGHSYACARRRSGTVACWGRNAEGQLGDGTTVDREDARDVPGLVDTVDLQCGSFNACASTTDGRISCWGPAWFGEVRGPTTPRLVQLPRPIQRFGMTGLIGCATLDSSDVYCWGRFVEFSGTLEIARDVGLVGELVRFARGAVRFGGGAAGTTCLAEESGNWWCQGSCKNLPSLGLPCSGLGQGIAWSSIQNTSPFEQLALGVVSGCGLDASGSLHCWSSDGSVGAGDGNLRRTNVPVPIRFGERVLQVAAGGFQGSLTTNEPERSSTCFITASRRLYCWGNGVLGDRSTVLYVPTRVVLSGGD